MAAIHRPTNALERKVVHLPVDAVLGFSDRMAVDFESLLTIDREGLEAMRANFRIGRLGSRGYEQFRERLGEYFRRYAYDEWYVLDKPEFGAYEKDHPGTEPFEWQK